MLTISFSKYHQSGWNVVRQTDAMARHSNNDREVICDICLISLCSVPYFYKIIKVKKK